jgi:hypothetical protein
MNNNEQTNKLRKEFEEELKKSEELLKEAQK